MPCVSSYQWFDAARQNNMSFIRKNVKKFNQQYDTRASDPANNIFEGFAAIHYAVYNGFLPLFKMLFHWEFECLTHEEVSSNGKKIRKYSNVLQIAMQRHYSEIVSLIV